MTLQYNDTLATLTCYLQVFIFYSYPDLVNYLLYTTSFVTKEEVKNYKSLESYRYFVAGWVQQTNWKVYNSVVLIRGRVKHSFRVSQPPLQPWIIIQKNGTVVCGHCTCMAGLAETCSHVGAVLYWIETAVRVRDTTTCTSKKNAWLMPTPVSEVPYLRLKDMKCHDQQTLSTTSCKHPPSAEELSLFYAELANCSKKSVVLSVIPPHNEKFVQSINHLPRALQSLYDPSNLELNFAQLLELAQQFEEKVTPAMRDHLEDITRSQSSSKKWFKYRAGRITASKLHAVVHTNPHQPSISLLKSICYPEVNSFKSASTEWGCSHEKQALESYKSAMQHDHENFRVAPCGFFISVDSPHLGASPDGLVSCDCHGLGIVEVKCPYSARNITVDDAAGSSSDFCLEHLQDGDLSLKLTHSYYYQCQLQLHVTKYSYCDFVVWTEQSIHIERVHLDDKLIQTVLPAANFFFLHCILPELLSKWFSREHCIAVSTINPENRPADDEDDGSWCYCKEERAGQMIACDNNTCPNVWYHLACLKMTTAPKGKWLCPSCHASSYHLKRRCTQLQVTAPNKRMNKIN